MKTRGGKVKKRKKVKGKESTRPFSNQVFSSRSLSYHCLCPFQEGSRGGTAQDEQQWLPLPLGPW